MSYDQKAKAAVNQFQNGDKWRAKTPEEAGKTAGAAVKKASFLGDLAGECITVCALIKDAVKGDYRAPWSTVAMLAGALAYVVCPIDVIPDVIPVVGYLDDIGVLGYALTCARDIIEDYKEWKKSH